MSKLKIVLCLFYDDLMVLLCHILKFSVFSSTTIDISHLWFGVTLLFPILH